MRTCRYCDQPTAAVRSVQCGSLACRRALKAEQTRRMYARAATGDREYPGTTDLVCSHCGKAYRARRRNKFCSRDCKAVGMYGPDRLQGRPTATRPPATAAHRRRLFERDAWTCHICRDPIDRASTWPAPLSPVLDHVVSVFLGGDSDDENLKTAHARCNSIKSWLPLAA